MMEKSTRKYIVPTINRGLAIFILVMAMVLIVMFVFTGTNKYNKLETGFSVEKGYMDLSGYNSETMMPVNISGEWEAYWGVFFNPGDSPEILDEAEYRKIPIQKAKDSTGTITYRLRVKGGDKITKPSLYFYNNKTRYNIFVNGKFMREVVEDYKSFLLTMYVTELEFDPSLEYQDIIISANQDPKQSFFYNTIPLLGEYDDVSDFVIWDWGMDILIIGILAVFLINGLVFMVMRPEFNNITIMTLFDTALIFRLFFGGETLAEVSNNIFDFTLYDTTILMFQISSIFFVGLAGIYLLDSIFNPKREYLLRFHKILVASYCCCLLSLPVISKYMLFDLSKTMALIAFFATILYGALNVACYVKRYGPHTYMMIQFIKSIYICIVIFIDLLQINSFYLNFRLFMFLYVAFFCIHLLVRLYDNNIHYKSVENLNQNLEHLVMQRTEELTRLNQTLSETSIRDHLTRTFNRLYFENLVERKFMEYNNRSFNLFLCIIDLDNFKEINDLYGHDIGDETLKFFVKTAETCLNSKCTLARIGGEEFVILGEDMEEEEFLNILKAIREKMEEASKTNMHVTTVSFGTVRLKEEMTYKELFKNADNCLYEAKNNGKNRIVMDF